MRRHSRKLFFAILFVAASIVAFTVAAPLYVDAQANTVALPSPYKASAKAYALHSKLFVADLHDDALLWSRDILNRYSYGHTDLPRLREGRVSLQVFSTVTKTPKALNFDSNGADTDNITMLAMAQRWPRRTWSSLIERALYQSEKLHTAALNSEGKLRIIRSQVDFHDALKMQLDGRGLLAGILSTEGLHALGGNIDNVDRLYVAGFRIAGLTHFFDNEIGGSAHGLRKSGLTPFGRDVVGKLEAKKIIVDLAHASPTLIDDVLAMAKRPVIISHTGVNGTCPGPRNISDAHIKAIATAGGIIGIAYFEGAICDLSPHGIVKAIQYATSIAGVKHVALGSDFDGAAKSAIDTTGLVLITQGLLDAGFTESDIGDIMGGNIQRFLMTQLPER